MTGPWEKYSASSDENTLFQDVIVVLIEFWGFMFYPGPVLPRPSGWWTNIGSSWDLTHDCSFNLVVHHSSQKLKFQCIAVDVYCRVASEQPKFDDIWHYLNALSCRNSFRNVSQNAADTKQFESIKMQNGSITNQILGTWKNQSHTHTYTHTCLHIQTLWIIPYLLDSFFFVCL